jgi:hypothetical protein
MKVASEPRAVFGVTKKDIPGVLSRALAIYHAMLANASTFPSPTVALATFFALITALSTAQENATETKARGTAKLRDTKRNDVWTAMLSLQSYVQGLANALSADAAASLIQLAGFVVAKSAAHDKAALTATLTATPGLVHLAANRKVLVGPADAAKKVMFSWAWSTDGGRTWNSAGSTPYASTDVPGLTLMTTYSFRVSVMVAKVAGPWSDPVSIVVH